MGSSRFRPANCLRRDPQPLLFWETSRRAQEAMIWFPFRAACARRVKRIPGPERKSHGLDRSNRAMGRPAVSAGRSASRSGGAFGTAQQRELVLRVLQLGAHRLLVATRIRDVAGVTL